MVYESFDKNINFLTSDETVKNDNISNKELTKELRKPIIRKFEKRKIK